MSNVKETSDRLKKYDLNKIVSWIKRFQFKKVALQFPNELLCEAEEFSAYLYQQLIDNLQVFYIFIIVNLIYSNFNHSIHQVFVLADTNFGSCCVDER